MSKKIFKGSVMLNPVPAVLITSSNSKGKTNVFTVAWTGIVCTKPPVLSISIRPERLSYEYIKSNGEFVVNLPSSKMVKILDYCGVRSGKKEDKIKKFGLTLKDSSCVKVPYIDECPISLECKVRDIIPLGTHDMFLADIVSCNVEESLMDQKGKIHFEKANLISYSHGEYFKLNDKPLGSFGYSVRKKKK
ncbi:flavin reductase family protein [Clostridium sediminicola]|uniref:flavin reductase family protein n=1 Tax=Clostridium sediminicola TaxID=3114879 RepID=UPI0031F1D464